MNHIQFSRLEDGLYEILEENDERLSVIGQLLFDDNLRNGIKAALEYAPEIGLEKRQEFETQLYDVHLSPDPVYGLLIKFIDKKDPERLLETDIKIDTLMDLIDQWEMAVAEEPEIITITRVQDTFVIETE